MCECAVVTFSPSLIWQCSKLRETSSALRVLPMLLKKSSQARVVVMVLPGRAAALFKGEFEGL
jgi:hypothetical protein